MRALAVLMLLIGVAAMLRPTADDTRDNACRAVAINYAAYRSAVFTYVYGHREHNGAVPMASLNLPTGWQALRAWSARVDDGRCYVYGEASYEEIAAVRDLYQGSNALGMASNGHLVPRTGNSIPVPNFIPDGSLVSVTEVD